MADIIRMPKMSDTMTEGVIAKWHKKVGDTVKSGELFAEIETDKATMDYESYKNLTYTERTLECPRCDYLQTWNLDDVDRSVFGRPPKP